MFGGRAAAAPVVLPFAMVAFLASQSTDDMAPIRVAGFVHMECAMPINVQPPQVGFRYATSLCATKKKFMFGALLNMVFRNNPENVCSVIHFSTPIK